MKAAVQGFNGRAEAMRWERLVKSRGRGYWERLNKLMGLVVRRCPMDRRKQKQRVYEVPAGLVLIVNPLTEGE